MGSAESIHNDTSDPVEVWFQLDGGDCPADGCAETTLQPYDTTSQKELALSLANQVCVKYGGGKEAQTVCKSVTSPGLAGQHDTYSVSDIIGRDAIPTPFTELHGAIEYVIIFAIVAAVIYFLYFKKFRRTKVRDGSQEPLMAGERNTKATKSPRGDRKKPTTSQPQVAPPLQSSPQKKATETSSLAGNLTRYQDLLCFACPANVPGRMMICTNLAQPWFKDPRGRDGFTALCPAHSHKVGGSYWYWSVAKPDDAIKTPHDNIKTPQGTPRRHQGGGGGGGGGGTPRTPRGGGGTPRTPKGTHRTPTSRSSSTNSSRPAKKCPTPPQSPATRSRQIRAYPQSPSTTTQKSMQDDIFMRGAIWHSPEQGA